jgi:hypothetical protein
MKENTPLDAAVLLKEAKTSEHQEAYRALERTLNYRIGMGVRLTPPNPPSFFVEILVYLSPDDNKVDVRILEKSLACLKALQARNFKTIFQDNNCISCEAQVSAEKLESEYELTKSLAQSNFNEK